MVCFVLIIFTAISEDETIFLITLHGSQINIWLVPAETSQQRTHTSYTSRRTDKGPAICGIFIKFGLLGSAESKLLQRHRSCEAPAHYTRGMVDRVLIRYAVRGFIPLFGFVFYSAGKGWGVKSLFVFD